MKHVTIGVAGHVDHGKTSFVKQITGIDTDRHPEEKRRGLSLEAGIACWPRPDGTVASFVDVPGHQDFLKNTVRGLQGVDLAVLLVAADDGVMPQTREHLDILSFFKVNDGMVVLSKTDCVDAETVELAELEIMELTAGTFLEGKPVIRFSAINGSGREEIITLLDLAMTQSSGKPPAMPFRLWIDQIRSFSGIGTVVSGTVLSGEIRVNDDLSIQPNGITTRVRSLEEHGRKIDEATAGQRIGINLHRVGVDDICRGMCLAAPGQYPPVSHFNATMQIPPHAGTGIKERQKVKLYLGVSVLTATVKFIDSPPDGTAGNSLVQMQLKKPAVVAAGDHFVVTPLNRNAVIAGGSVLEHSGEKVREANKAIISGRLKALQADDLAAYVAQFCRLHPGIPIDVNSLAIRTIWSPARIEGYVASGLKAKTLVDLSAGKIVRAPDLETFTSRFVDILKAAFAAKPDRQPMQVPELIHQCRPACDEKLAVRIVDDLCRKGLWDRMKGGITPADFRQRLPEDLTGVGALLQRYAEDQGLRPFSAGYFVKTAEIPLTLRQTQRTLDFFCKTGEMIRLNNERYLTSSAMAGIKKKVGAWIVDRGELCLRDCKEALDFNRSLGLPVLEYLDQIGFTIQHGEGRIVANSDLNQTPGL
ncbi:MAG: selenocysteine-specific translation elongation factor [Proteobacteria bacterium]|nr:selenocysteine-specific translation elongation factor [Pseudomonadota bacterium]MBU1738569.1 selenocysteine-specific translation elongation factor [Pseudomonadota bacterium]